MKKTILVLILLIPSLIYFFFELTHANFKKLPYYGPKQAKTAGSKDTIYYTLPSYWFRTQTSKDSTQISKETQPLYAIAFVDEKYRDKGFCLRGIVEYTELKKKDMGKIPLYLVMKATDSATVLPQYKDSLKLQSNSSVHQLYCNAEKFKEYRNAYFKEKPYYIMDYFVLLIDQQRHVRGYYDASFVPEVKRLLEEFEHLKLRDEHQRMEVKDKIEQR